LKTLLFPLAVILLIACNKKERRQKPFTHGQTTTAAIILNYDSCKKEIFLAKQKNK
jgi:hypothetical protein